MLPGRTYTFDDILGILKRRLFVIAIPVVLAGVATVAVLDRLPNRYRSSTLIMVVPQRVPESYVKSTVTARIEDRLQSLSQQLRGVAGARGEHLRHLVDELVGGEVVLSQKVFEFLTRKPEYGCLSSRHDRSRAGRVV